MSKRAEELEDIQTFDAAKISRDESLPLVYIINCKKVKAGCEL